MRQTTYSHNGMGQGATVQARSHFMPDGAKRREVRSLRIFLNDSPALRTLYGALVAQERAAKIAAVKARQQATMFALRRARSA